MVARDDEFDGFEAEDDGGFDFSEMSTKERCLLGCERLCKLVELDAPLAVLMNEVSLLMKRAVCLSIAPAMFAYIERTIANGYEPFGEPFGDPE